MYSNSKATDAFEGILLEIQEVLDKYTSTRAIILLGDMNSSLLNRGGLDLAIFRVLGVRQNSHINK